tara:strand:+ start:1081 stop:1239 length:159 start_codon:yes stop_codon:yes gene_type:complete
MKQIMEAIDFVIDFIVGKFEIDSITNKRAGDDRRVKKPRKRKNEKRVSQRRN